jgi:hypothetical protein
MNNSDLPIQLGLIVTSTVSGLPSPPRVALQGVRGRRA